jgi:hypothetical protein
MHLSSGFDPYQIARSSRRPVDFSTALPKEKLWIELSSCPLKSSTSIVYQFQQAASYVNRILKGEKPSELPVQAPNKFELVSTSRPQTRPAHNF